MSRTRNFTWTWNNYDEGSITFLHTLSSECRYLCYGREVCPSTGTPHLQGFLILGNPSTASAIRKRMPGVHVECSKGSPIHNRDYCSKGGDFKEYGTPPVSGTERGDREVSRYSMAWDQAKAGDLESIDADIRIRCYNTLKRIKYDFRPVPEHLAGVCGTWIHGEAGCGKTTSVFAAYPDCYSKPIKSKWWDGYADQPIVLFDDVSIYERELGTLLKHAADSKTFYIESKGLQYAIRPTRVFVTSQYTIEEIWDDQKTRDALLRRFVVINKIKGQDIILYYKGSALGPATGVERLLCCSVCPPPPPQAPPIR